MIKLAVMSGLRVLAQRARLNAASFWFIRLSIKNFLKGNKISQDNALLFTITGAERV